MQLCYAHCFAEQLGLLAVDAPHCCAADDDDSMPVKDDCVVCDMMHTGGVTLSKPFKCLSVDVALLPDASFDFIDNQLPAITERLVKPASDDVFRPPANVWVALVCTAHPVRGPSVA